MLNAKISPSMMCANLLDIKKDLEELKKAEVEYLHIDIMDGVFVPNITLSNDIAKNFRKVSDIPFDYHLMIVEPTKKIDWFELKENDMLSFHIEAEGNVEEGLRKIKEKKAKAGLAISPNTPVSSVYPYLDMLDFCVVMCVHPGFAGQKMIPETLEKIKELRNYLDTNGYQHIMIEVDGNVSFENSTKMRNKGADIFVGGTSSVFNQNGIVDCVKDFRESIKKGENNE